MLPLNNIDVVSLLILKATIINLKNQKKYNLK